MRFVAMNKFLIAAALALAATGAHAEEKHVCRGIVTVNWTESVTGDAPDDGSRLILAPSSINNSCLFSARSAIGRQILNICPMGHPCEVRASISDEPADVYITAKVSTVRRLD